MAKQEWTVRYELMDKKKPINRHFSTEKKARAYYKKLWFRWPPPASQTIFPKGTQ